MKPPAFPIVTPASISMPAMSSSSASSRWSAGRGAPRCWPASAASAPWWSFPSAVIDDLCWSREPTASAPSCASPSTPGATTPSASTWWRCASTMSWCRAPSRCFFWTTTRPASFGWRSPKLDYYATGKLRVAIAEAVIRGIVEGCVQAGAALVGGETAEMPGMYQGEDYDLAGFCVGVVEKDSIIDGRSVSAGDAVIGLSSSGPHSNGYSLIRKIVSVAGADLAADLEGRPLGERLLAPTRIYVKSLLELIRAMPVHGLAHITGGGLTDNIPRVLPEGLEVVLSRRSWHRDPTF